MTEEEVKNRLIHKFNAEWVMSMEAVKEFLSSIPGIVSTIIKPNPVTNHLKPTPEKLVLTKAWEEEIDKNLDELRRYFCSYPGCPTFLAIKFFEGEKNDLMDYQVGFYLDANSGSQFLPIGYGLYADYIKGI